MKPERLLKSARKHRFSSILLAPTLLTMWPLVLLPLCPKAVLAAGGGAKFEVSDSPFIGQTQIAATRLQSSRAVGVFQVDMGILVPNPIQRRRAAALQPVLRDVWRRTIQEFTNSYLIQGQVPDAVLLGQRLQAATDHSLGQGVARVLLVSVVVR